MISTGFWPGFSNGEEVAIAKHHRTVARLLPAHARKTANAGMPDFAGRLQKVFGRKVVSDKTWEQSWTKAGGPIESLRRCQFHCCALSSAAKLQSRPPHSCNVTASQ